ncbi:MAG: hypothetical protein DWI63_04950 [Chloroflexi bacterium]|nr:MAG: hypothetical protein DWI63_04950 [Chloroflexota bacterium]
MGWHARSAPRGCRHSWLARGNGWRRFICSRPAFGRATRRQHTSQQQVCSAQPPAMRSASRAVQFGCGHF